jgi:hypothetical protein
MSRVSRPFYSRSSYGGRLFVREATLPADKASPADVIASNLAKRIKLSCPLQDPLTSQLSTRSRAYFFEDLAKANERQGGMAPKRF